MTGLVILACVTIAASVTAIRPDALQCGPCDPSHCPAIGECHRGITWDVCNCCEVCAKGINDECGGPWSAYGKCGFGLTCLKDARDCPYLFNPRGSASDTGSNICDEYLFNAIGRCVQSGRVVESAFKRNLAKELLAEEQRQQQQQQQEQQHHQQKQQRAEPAEGGINSHLTPEDDSTLVGKRLMLKGVLRGVEY